MKIINKHIIIFFSILGLIICIAVLFPQVRQMIMDFVIKIAHKEPSTQESWIKVFLSYAIGGIFFILFFDFCTITNSGRFLVRQVKQELKHCLSEIDFRSFAKPVLIISGIYLLGIITIVRANFLYIDDIARAVAGYRKWYPESRYISEFTSIFVNADTNMTDISPLPQLLAIFILAISSVLLVYVISNKKITLLRLIASIPLGLSPYFLSSLSFKFDAPYMALSILASIVPFLFITRNKAFIFSSILSLLVMCMTYQASSGIYLMIALMLCFMDWNYKRKPLKKIFYFFGTVCLSFCSAMLVFRLFLMKPLDINISTSTLPFKNIIIGILNNIKNYFTVINNDFGIIWKIGILLVTLFFIFKLTFQSKHRKPVSFIFSVLVTGTLLIFSYGIYYLLEEPSFRPSALLGFGVFLAIICIYIVSEYKKTAIIAVVLALNWCFFVFAFSYGNALADQKRYANFRIGLLLQDLSSLFPEKNKEDLFLQINNSIDYTPVIKNIAKNYPVIERLVPLQLEKENLFSYIYFHDYFNWGQFKSEVVPYSKDFKDYRNYNLPVVLNSYYHTIQSDGIHILITLK